MAASHPLVLLLALLGISVGLLTACPIGLPPAGFKTAKHVIVIGCDGQFVDSQNAVSFSPS